MKYNIGQILTLKEDLETEGCFGTKKIRKVGTKMWVKAEKRFTINYIFKWRYSVIA